MMINSLTGQVLNSNPEGHNQYFHPVDLNSGVPTSGKGFASKDGKYFIAKHRPGYGEKSHYLRSNRTGAILGESDNPEELMDKAVNHEIIRAQRKSKK